MYTWRLRSLTNRSKGKPRNINGLFTLDNTENENDSQTETDNDNYGFHCNMQSIVHCTETLPLMPLANFSHFIGLATHIILGVAQCEHTTKQNDKHQREVLHSLSMQCEWNLRILFVYISVDVSCTML